LSAIGGQGLWFPVFALTAFGMLFVYSASSIYALENFGNEFLFVKKQALAVAGGLVAAACGLVINLDYLLARRLWVMLGGVAALAATHLPGLGHSVNGAARWIKFGGFTTQPAEFAKVAAVIFAAGAIGSALHAKDALRGLLIFALVLPLLLLQPDFGSTVVIMGTVTVMLFVGGFPLRFFAAAGLLALPTLGALMLFWPYRMRRLVTFLDPFADPLGSGFQVIQSFLAVASGGLFGKGLGNSTQKLFFLPEAHNDFVAAVVGEEMGFAGILVLIAMLGLLFFALINILLSLQNRVHMLLCTGLFCLLSGNALVNLGMVVGLLPTKGLPLPFVSAGGSSYVLSMFAIGLFGQAWFRQTHPSTERTLSSETAT
jgi:cell division protein FtsW